MSWPGFSPTSDLLPELPRSRGQLAISLGDDIHQGSVFWGTKEDREKWRLNAEECRKWTENNHHTPWVANRGPAKSSQWCFWNALGDSGAWYRLPMTHTWATGSACSFVRRSERNLPEASVTWKKSGEAESQWHSHVFVSVSNYDTQERQESEGMGMFCDTDSEAENSQPGRVNLIKRHSRCRSLPFYA